jgi:cytochrome c oxidase subunit 2
MAIVILLVLVVLGSILFHVFSPWWWTPIASNWTFIDSMITLTFWITGAVFAAIILFMAYCVYKFQHTEGRIADYEPENTKLEVWLTIITSIGITALLIPGLVVWFQFVTVPDDATEVEVLAQQWYWSYRLPGKDGKLGTVDNRLISDDNPLGINPNDPDGQDDVVIDGDDLHLPIGKPVKMLLRSADVLHDFMVPEFRAKMDMVPGMVSYFWFEPTRVGEFDVLCAELCGTGHYLMSGKVFIDTEEEYELWLPEQPTFAEVLSSRNIDVADVRTNK